MSLLGSSTQTFRMLVTADTTGAVGNLKAFEGQVQKSSTGVAQKLGMTDAAFQGIKMAAAGVGAATALQLGKYSVNAARDLTEAVNAVNVMYGNSADEVVAMSETAATSLGLSKRAFDESAVAVGGFVNQISAINGDQADKVLGDLMTRAADFGSVFNIDVDEALQRFRSGLAGETEPLRRFGINLLQSEVAAYAVAEGIVEMGDTMTEEEKVLARYGLLMQKTSLMQGDFANTSGDLANAQRILKAELENVAASMGGVLVPEIEKMVNSMIVLIETGKDFEDWMMEGWGVPEVVGGLEAWYETTMNVVNPLNLFGKVIGEVRGETEEAYSASDKYATSLSKQRTAARAAAAMARKQARDEAAAAEATEVHDDWVNMINSSMATQITRLENKERADQRAADAVEAHVQAQEDLFDSVNHLLGSLFEYEEATINLSNNVEELAGLTGDDLRLAQIDLAREALATAEAFATEQGAVEGTTEYAALQRGELVRLADQYPEIRDEIYAYIEALELIPREINTVVKLSGGRYGRTNELGQVTGFSFDGVTGSASGTHYGRGVTMVGERGPELVNLPAGSTVTSAKQTGHMLASGGGGVTVQIMGNVYGDTAIHRAIDDAARKAASTMRAGKR